MTAPEENKAIFRHVWESWYKGNLGPIREYYDPGVIDHEAIEGQPPGLEGLIHHATVFTNAFSDQRWTVEAQVADGDLVVTRWTLRRKHTGDFMGIAPTGKEVVLTGT